MPFGVPDGRPAHQHRAGVKAEHRVIPAGQPVQAAGRIERPAYIIEEDVHRRVAAAGPFLGAEHLRRAVMLFKRAVGAVAVKPLALGIVRQPAEHIHLEPVCKEAFHHIVDAEVLGPEVLGHNQDALLGHGLQPFLAPHHFVHHAGVALDDLDDLV